jgi:Immunity protein 35
MTKDEARELALLYVKNRESEAGCELVLLDNQTMEKNFGWVFFYDSKVHAETGDFRYSLAGNAPVVVTRADGVIHETGTARPVEQYIERFEEGVE